MALIYQYLELYESKSISSFWKGLQILLYVLGALTSFAASFTFGTFYHIYCDNYCILYSSVTFIKEPASIPHPTIDISKGDVNTTILDLPLGSIDLSTTIWAKGKTAKTCDFCLYSIVFSFIICFIWATFFTMCGKGGKAKRGLPASWRIVFPALITNLIYFAISIAAASSLSNGFDVFCTHLMQNMNEKTCKDALYEYDRSPFKRAFAFLRLSLIFFKILTVIWSLSIATLVLRCLCVPDFELYNIQIQTPTSNRKKLTSKKAHLNADLEPNKNTDTSITTEEKQSTSETHVIQATGQENSTIRSSLKNANLGKNAELGKRKPQDFLEAISESVQDVADTLVCQVVVHTAPMNAVSKTAITNNPATEENERLSNDLSNNNFVSSDIIYNHNMIVRANQNEKDSLAMYNTYIENEGTHATSKSLVQKKDTDESFV